ncbi:MAG: PEP-CTERM sorting domain-containing protein [Syntrophobacteraceae bacterium]
MKPFKLALCAAAGFLALTLGNGYAKADYVYQLNHNNGGVIGSIGTVDVSLTGSSLARITFTLDTGYYIQGSSGRAGNSAAANVTGTFTADNSYSYKQASGYSGTPTWQGLGGGSLGGHYGSFTQVWDKSRGHNDLVYSVTFTVNGNWTSDSSVLSANAGGYVAGLHVFSSYTWNCNKQTFFAAADIKSGSEVPEPSTLILLGSGMLGWMLFYRRRQKAQERA